MLVSNPYASLIGNFENKQNMFSLSHSQHADDTTSGTKDTTGLHSNSIQWQSQFAPVTYKKES